MSTDNDWGWFIDIDEYEDIKTQKSKPNKFVSSRYVSVLKTISEAHSFDSFVDLEANIIDKYIEKRTNNLTSYCVVAVAAAYCFAFLTL